MLQLFRNFFKSKLGVGITLGFLVLIAIAFASSDVANTSCSAALPAATAWRVVGGERIDAAELAQNMTNALDGRASRPTRRSTMQAFIAQGGIDNVLDATAQPRRARRVRAASTGCAPATALVDSEIAKIPALPRARRQFQRAGRIPRRDRASSGLSEAMVREDLVDGPAGRASC